MKPRKDFNREHVIPEAFGKFVNNMVLSHIVCRDCNTFFGRELDSLLGRESPEGIQRFLSGMKEVPDGRKFGRTKRLHLSLRGGKYDGMLLEWIKPDDGSLGLASVPIKQIGVGHDPEGPWKWFAVDELPTKDELRAQGYGPKMSLQAGGLETEEARTLLVARGFIGQIEFEPTNDGVMFEPYSTIPTHVHGFFDELSARAVAKVAMNYLAHEQPQVARMEQTGAIRQFIRFGGGDWRDFVTVKTVGGLANAPPGTQVLLHTVSATWEPKSQCIVGHVSLLDWNKYLVNLGSGFIVHPTHIASGHAFDPFNRRIHALQRGTGKKLNLSTHNKLDF